MTGPAGLRILIVEDNADTATTLALLLRLRKHEVTMARDGQAAMVAYQSDRPDVVLLDIGLPGKMSGWHIARWIRDQGGEKRPWVVAISGYGTAEDQARSVEAGVDLHLLKPVDPQVLLGMLDRLRNSLVNQPMMVKDPAAGASPGIHFRCPSLPG
jgi:CheY-like chemotaxis protein